jgi:hypothetical protein
MTSDSETESEGNIYGKECISINGKILSTDIKTTNSVNNISIKGSDINIEFINNTIYSDSIYFLFI